VLANQVRTHDIDCVTPLPTYSPIHAVVDGHDLTFVFGGHERLQAMLDAIAHAKSALRLYFYIFAADATATLIADALIEARYRGIAVSLLVDGFGTPEQPDHLFVAMRDAGILVARFSPRLGRKYLLRNHQKMLIVDQHVAIIGGSNIADAYFADDPAGNSWHDLNLRIEGSAVARLANYYDALAAWIGSPSPGIFALLAILRDHSDRQGSLRWLYGGPSHRLNAITRSLRETLSRALQVDMIQAYFAPNWGFLRRLGAAAQRGRFRLITAARSDNSITIAAARHCYWRLLRHPSEIYEYQAAKLHMKLVVADNIIYVGSANFDMRSLYLNTEIMLRIDDPVLSEKLRVLVEEHCSHSVLIDRTLHRARSSWHRRLRWTIGYFIVAVFDFGVTRNLNWKTD
jgi:cardiolipin synthase A/B